MRRCAAALAWTLAALGPALAQAQGVQTAVEPPDSLACLQPPTASRGTPEFPEALLAARQRGTVKVELVFDAPDREPSMTVTDNSGSDEFVPPVREFVSRYRMPCLPVGTRSTVRQEFFFNPTDGRRVRWLEPTSDDEVRVKRGGACLIHGSGDLAPNYPARALSADIHGKVVVKLRFEAPDRAPRAEVVGGAEHRELDAAVLRHVAGLRMPCYEGTPVTLTHLYHFRFAGTGHAALKDMPLLAFLRNVKGIDTAVVYFDFGRMACPFDLRIRLNQPYSANGVGEVGDGHPERRHFIEWLRRQEFDLNRRVLAQVVGESMTLSVPCGVLNLGPTSGGGASQ